MKTIRTGIGFDAHRLKRGRKLVLGGVEIKHELGLEGHSDADVLCHAIMDALLGAVADGDIGMHFPDTDPKWAGARSLDLMKPVLERLKIKGARVINVDSMVLAEAPKLLPHVPQMRKNIARVLHIPVDCVSIKATTLEKMGSIGRKEGMAVMAVATVEQKGRGRAKG
jgi:2-C-methyl-D-erythritol 2,4-cyclodiphosphate synthase